MTAPCARELAAGRDLWFSDKAADRAEAHRICSACPAREGCQKGAEARQEPHGVWGEFLGKVDALAAEEKADEFMVAGFPRPAVRSAAQHGTRAKYTAGCRCDPCTESNAAYMNGRDRTPQDPVTPEDRVDVAEALTLGLEAS